MRDFFRNMEGSILYFSEKNATDNKQLAADQGTIRGTVW